MDCLGSVNDTLFVTNALCKPTEDQIKSINSTVRSVLLTLIPSLEEFALEHEMDQLEHDIETRCMRMLLQQQPVARDLRIISAALKMISDMILKQHTTQALKKKSLFSTPLW